MNKTLPLNIFMQAKGGVGKSVSTFIFAQYLQDSLGIDNCVFIDTDPKNCSFAAYKDLDVAYFNATVTNKNTGETKIDTMATNAIFEEIMTYSQAVAVDTGSSNYIDLKSYLQANNIFEAFNEIDEIKRDVIIHVPINGGSDFAFCIDELGQLFEDFKTVKFVVWLNHYGGKLQTIDGKIFSETKIANMLQGSGRFLGVVEYPQLTDLQAQSFRLMMSSNLTFKEAKQDASGNFTILSKTALDKVRQFFYKELDDVFPEYAENRAKLNSPNAGKTKETKQQEAK